jgi:hypothetical protein
MLLIQHDWDKSEHATASHITRSSQRVTYTHIPQWPSTAPDRDPCRSARLEASSGMATHAPVQAATPCPPRLCKHIHASITTSHRVITHNTRSHKPVLMRTITESTCIIHKHSQCHAAISYRQSTKPAHTGLLWQRTAVEWGLWWQ